MLPHVTQKFLANAAGVSQKTVSLFLKGDSHISKGTKAKLERLCGEYKYFPNIAARSMRDRSFKRIACVLSHVGCEAPHFMSYIRSAALELETYGYSMVIEPFQLDDEGDEVICGSEFFRTLSVDGAIGISGSSVPAQIDQALREMGVPAVWLNRYASGVPCMTFDETGAIERLIEHLLSRGRRRIAWFGPPSSVVSNPTHYSFADRLRAVGAALKSHGFELFRTTASTIGGNITAAAFELFDGDLRPDAIVCYNRDFYDCAFHVASHLGLASRGLDIASFASSWEFSPGLSDFRTFVLLPEREMAERGARFICERIAGRDAEGLLEPIAATLHIGKSINEDIQIGRRPELQ